MREDFRVFLGCRNHILDLVQLIRIMHAAAVDDAKLLQIVMRGSHQIPIRDRDMQPHRKENVDLVNMLFERRISCGIVGLIIGRPQAFVGVEGNVRMLGA